MRALLIPLALLATGLPPMAVGAPAHAAASCLGQPATVETTEGTALGTPGPDVIVAGGTTTQILADDGADLVCLTGGNSLVHIDAGPGDDVVDTTAATSVSATVLGPGADRFTGGGSGEHVTTGPDTGPDTVTTGDGTDALTALAGGVRADLGPGRDEVEYGEAGVAPGSVVATGTGRDDVLVVDSRSVRLDLHRHRIQLGGVVTELRQAEDVYAIAPRVVVRGDGDENEVTATGCRIDLHGGGGDDRLSQWFRKLSCRGGEHTRMRGDAGADELLGSHEDDVLEGGAGPDKLLGWAGNDILLGGPGRDSATAGRGRDLCVAEHQVACER